jgi:hypothetical protein
MCMCMYRFKCWVAGGGGSFSSASTPSAILLAPHKLPVPRIYPRIYAIVHMYWVTFSCSIGKEDLGTVGEGGGVRERGLLDICPLSAPMKVERMKYNCNNESESKRRLSISIQFIAVTMAVGCFILIKRAYNLYDEGRGGAKMIRNVGACMHVHVSTRYF